MIVRCVDLVSAPTLASLLGIILFTTQEQEKLNSLAYLIVVLSSLPLFFNKIGFRFLFFPSSLFLIGALSLQLIFSIFVKKTTSHLFEDGWILTMGILLWRSLFSALSLIFFKKSPENDSDSDQFDFKFYLIVFMRALCMLISYATLIFSLQAHNPFTVLPILNSGTFISTCLAHFILKEKLVVSDIIAFLGLSCSLFI